MDEMVMLRQPDGKGTPSSHRRPLAIRCLIVTMKECRVSIVGISAACVLALALVPSAPPALGERCPQAGKTGPDSASEARTLEGRLIFHDAIRKWFELKLDEPRCGETSIELVRVTLDDWRPLQVLRGCRVRSSGSIGFSSTGYYSLDLNQDVEEIESIGTCDTQLPFPDYSGAKPDETVREYRVHMHVDFGASRPPDRFSPVPC